MKNVEYKIKEEKGDVIRYNGEKETFTIIYRQSKYYAVTIEHGNITSEFEVYKLISAYNTYYEKLEKDQKPRIQWCDDFIYPQDSEWWQPHKTLKVFTEYDWGGGYWKEYSLQEYLTLRGSYGTRARLEDIANFLDKLANIMVFLK